MLIGLVGMVGLLASCSVEERVPWAHAGIPRFEGRGAPTREQGAWSYWYPNGQLREQGTYEDGRRKGTWKQWFRNGQRASEGERRWNAETGASEREGPWTFWHENGQLRARGTFVAGQRSGFWEGWDDAGDVDPAWTGTFESGVKAR